jgi:hypothetical protein
MVRNSVLVLLFLIISVGLVSGCGGSEPIPTCGEGFYDEVNAQRSCRDPQNGHVLLIKTDLAHKYEQDEFLINCRAFQISAATPADMAWVQDITACGYRE